VLTVDGELRKPHSSGDEFRGVKVLPGTAVILMLVTVVAVTFGNSVRASQAADTVKPIHQMNYYLNLYSPATYDAYSASDRSLTRFRKRHEEAATRVMPGCLAPSRIRERSSREKGWA
jgi:hypothetical protein